MKQMAEFVKLLIKYDAKKQSLPSLMSSGRMAWCIPPMPPCPIPITHHASITVFHLLLTPSLVFIVESRSQKSKVILDGLS